MERIQRGINKLDHATFIYANGNVAITDFINTVKNQADANLVYAYELKRRKQHVWKKK
ncbi:hypothetical protein [Lactiplantibacillus mudanjiangensis]|uniref:Uncharacterized protein n=1 Tax=Lactiplantibacillus mudanjiangensis TaxID=1296538 RepID=A0A660E4G0_9LACO|nr:hypothetical protein [Lactiplantibacillus mudanjiangensis]VDG24224.1 hypothetical protein MUDAN_IGPPGNFN_02493 [Lactiplantibacillus mudanjiangensis]VDG30202.1 hypothetical protein MUDAN_MDHGFNIF_01755 [Lactiplantibacillus mudanjiangensis]